MSPKARALVQPTCKASSSFHSDLERGLRVQRSDNFRSRIIKVKLGPADLRDSLPVTFALTAQVHNKQLKRTGVTRRLSSILRPGGRVRKRDNQIQSNRVINLILVNSFHRLLVLDNAQMKRPRHPVSVEGDRILQHAFDVFTPARLPNGYKA